MVRSLILLLLLSAPAFAQEREPLHRHPTIQAMLHENNRIRDEEELSPHVISSVLTKAAQDQALYMARTHDFEHVTIDNGSPGVRAARYGYSGTVRENLGRASRRKPWNISTVFVKWKESPDHWQSIIDPFKEVGFGYAIAEDGTQYWVALYGTPRKAERWGRVLNHQEESPPSRKSPSRRFVGSTPNFLLISSSASNL